MRTHMSFSTILFSGIALQKGGVGNILGIMDSGDNISVAFQH